MVKLAIILPFCRKDFNDLLFNISLWNKKGHRISTNDKTYSLDLIFYYGTSTKDEIDKYKQILSEKIKPFKKYFNKIGYDELIITKTEDRHPQAPAIMFFNFLLSRRYDCFYYCEPDCIPVKDDWLLNIEKHCQKCFNDDIWIKGCMYSGDIKVKNADQLMHINGNAFFNVKVDQAINLFKRIRKHININRAYDVDMIRYLLSNPSDLKLFYLHCSYTDFLLNFGRRPVPNRYLKEIPKNTYFVHGNSYLKIIKSKYK